METSALHITCARGVPPILAAEVTALGYEVFESMDSGVVVHGAPADAMRLNLSLRTAHRVLLLIREFKAADADRLYEQVSQLPWERFIPEDGYLCVTASGRGAGMKDMRFASLRCKDAIVDRLASACGRRPDSGSDRDRSVVHLHWQGRDASVYLDTSGEPLSHRGYRLEAGAAPMRETLAAACVLAARWDGRRPFVNPMCGSGTLAIEAALIATGRAPGLLRENFAFMHLKDFDATAWRKIRGEIAHRRPSEPGRILASDLQPSVMAKARRNAARAGVEDLIEWAVCDFRECEVPRDPGVILFNPEYGERLGEEQKLRKVYREIGDFLKQECAGYRGYVFTGNLRLAKEIGLRSSRRIPLYNGEIECRLLEYELFAGSLDHRSLSQGGDRSSSRGTSG